MATKRKPPPYPKPPRPPAEPPLKEAWVVPQLTARVFPEMIEKLGLLNPTTIHSVIAAYNALEDYYDTLWRYMGELFPDVSRKLVDDPSRRRVIKCAFA